MFRKRKSTKQPPTEPTGTVEQPAAEAATAVTEPAPAEAAVVADVPMAMPVADDANGGNFTEKVEAKKWVTPPDPFGIAQDKLAGVRLFESKQDRQMAIKFGEGRPEDKPSQAVIDRMKEEGYRWNPRGRVWTHPVRPESAMSTRIEAELLYQEVRQMIRQEKGIEAAPEVPF